jgi:hypothetical protein
MLDILVVDSDAGEMSDAPDCGGVDGHESLEK